MDLVPENPVQENKEKKISIPLIVVIILIIILIIGAAFLFMYIQQLKEQQFKVIIDGIQNSSAGSEEGLFIIEDGKVYTSINGICPYLSYKFYPGEYKQFSEDRTKCYVNNLKEIVTFSSGSNEIVKYPRFRR